MSLRALCSIVVMLLAGPVLADTVWLDNGDRLSGEIVLMDGGKLALKTRYAGQVLIDWKDIDTISSDKPLLIKQQGVSGQRSRTLEAAGKGMVRIVDGGSHTVPLASIRQMVPPRPLVEDLVWEAISTSSWIASATTATRTNGSSRAIPGFATVPGATCWRGKWSGKRRTGARSRTTGSWTTTSIASSTNTGSGAAAIRRSTMRSTTWSARARWEPAPATSSGTTNSGVSTWSPRSVAGNWSGAISRARISPPIRWSGTTSGCSPAPGWSCTAREPCWFPASSGSTTCSTANTACAIA
ncbi:hypothetical protein PAKAF_04657 [Pseudomonas aeruginosa PAK]|nr:hypothetical protein PAKAF_04657 [Pseudomonas aeruginosa PAK]